MAAWWALRFYKSKAWLDCRAGYIDTVHGLCERCDNAGLIVHHKDTLTQNNINDPSVSLNWEKLEYLCIDCHNKDHHGSHEHVTREGLTFNQFGDLVQCHTPL